MNATLPMLLVGTECAEADRAEIRALEAALPGLRFALSGPALDEPGILDALEGIGSSRPPLLVLDALHGNSARAVALAALKAGVPAAVWCHDGRHSLASASIAAGALGQLGLPHVLLHGGPERVARELEAACGAAAAMQKLKRARIGQLGGLHRNLLSAAVDPLVLAERFGAWAVPLDMAELRERMAGVDPARVERELAELKRRYDVTAGDDTVRRAAAVRLAMRGMAEEHRLDAIAAGCWGGIVPEAGAPPCLEFAYDTFAVACEGDVTLALTLLAGREICGAPGYCGDLYSFDEADGTAALMHCAGCAGLHAGRGRMGIAAQRPPAAQDRGRELAAARPELAPGPGVAVLLHGRNLELLHLRRCEILRSDFTSQMQVFIRIEGDPAGFRREAAGNHYVVFPGDSHDAWALWAKWSGVAAH